MQDDEEGSYDMCCPNCGTIQDAFEVYTHSANSTEGTSACTQCGDEITDDEWITD